MATAHINIGSNLGDRAALIERAVALIRERIDAGARVSDMFESKPWGFSSHHSFLNVAVMAMTVLAPFELFEKLKTIQNEIDSSSHRNADGTYADRAIDIDLIAIDNLILNTADLILPHPRMQERGFVLFPMSQLSPDWQHPLNGLTCSEMLEELNCRKSSKCSRFGV